MTSYESIKDILVSRNKDSIFELLFAASMYSKEKVKVAAAIVNSDMQTSGIFVNKNVSNSALRLICHAEINALVNTDIDLAGATLYCTHCPCIECAIALATAGASEVIYMYELDTSSRKTLEDLGIVATKYEINSDGIGFIRPNNLDKMYD